MFSVEMVTRLLTLLKNSMQLNNDILLMIKEFYAVVPSLRHWHCYLLPKKFVYILTIKPFVLHLEISWFVNYMLEV